VPPVVSSEIDWAAAFVVTVTFTPAPIKTTSLAPGAVPLSQTLAAPQGPLLVAVMAAAGLSEGKSALNRRNIGRDGFIFMVNFLVLNRESLCSSAVVT
jgi:hypothetical protein